MQRFIHLLFLISILLLPSIGFSIDMPDKAAMVIRFDRTVPVNYERSLQKIVQTALRVKPGTFFDIISIFPHVGDKLKDQASENWANDNTTAIVQKLIHHGVDANSIRVTPQPGTNTLLNEVHIFVR